jgi:dihydrofolate reductase
MRRLVEATFVSLDGVIEAPELWAMPLWGRASKEAALARLNEFDAFLLGRATYEKFAATWSPIKGDPYFDRVNSLPKFVASRTLTATTWNATLIRGEVAEEVAKLKQVPGKGLIKYGTGALDQPLINHRLIDEFQFSIFPIVVGSGLRLFEGVDTSRLKLRLRDSQTSDNGIVTLSYVMSR